MEILIDEKKNLKVQQCDGSCSCGHKLWCALGVYKGWTACTRCNLWFWPLDPVIMHDYGSLEPGQRHKLLLAEYLSAYEAGNDEERIKIMSILLSNRNIS